MKSILPQPSTRPTAEVRWALAALSLSVLMSSLGTSIANVGLPTLAQTFGVSLQQVQWVVLAYLIALTTSIVSVGRLGDLLGRKMVLMAGVLLFTLASLVCGMASSLWMLVAFRTLQGLGAAFMLSLTLACVGEVLPRAKTGSAMGLLGTMSAVGTALGPSLGGALLLHSGWPVLFLIQVPLGVVALVLLGRFLPAGDTHTQAQKPGFDAAGTVLLAVSLVAYALAMTLKGHFAPMGWMLLLTAAGGAGLFVLAEKRATSPLVPLSLFKNPRLGPAFAMNVLVTTVVMATLVVGPFYLSGALLLDPVQAGLVMSAGPLVSALTGVPAGRAVDRLGPHRMTVAGLTSMLVGCLLMSVLPVSAGAVGYGMALVITTAGYAVFQAANNTAGMLHIQPDQRGVVSGLLNLSRNLGLITGASLMGALFALGSTWVRQPVLSAGSGLHLTFAVATGLVAVALVLGWLNLPDPRKNAPAHT